GGRPSFLVAGPIVSFLRSLSKHLNWALATGVILGISLPGLAQSLREWLSALVYVLTLASFLKIDTPILVRSWRRPLLPCLLVVWCLIISPIAIGCVLLVLSVPTGLAQALIVWAASPPMTAAIVFSILLRLDVSLTVGVSLIGMLVVPMTGPPLSL